MIKGRLNKFTLCLLALAVTGAIAGIATAANPHFVGSKSCVQSGDTVTCSFTIAGLGSQAVDVTISANFSCQKTNGGDQFVQPGGLASTDLGSITPENGRITVTDATLSGSCPDGFSANFGGAVSVFV